MFCVESEGQRYQNWTVNSSQHNLKISTLIPGRRYWITIAAVNGAGVGMLSDPHGFVISEQSEKKAVHSCCDQKPATEEVIMSAFCFISDPQMGNPPASDGQNRDLSQVVALLKDPVLIGIIGVLLCCVLMVAAVYLFRRHGRTGSLIPARGRDKGACTPLEGVRGGGGQFY